DSPEGWRGTVKTLTAEHAGLGVKSAGGVPVSYFPGVAAPGWAWQVGTGSIEFLLSSRSIFTVAHQGSRGGEGRWESQGAVARLPVSQRLIDDVRKLLDMPGDEAADRGGVKVAANDANASTGIVLSLDWNLKFSEIGRASCRERVREWGY